MKTGKTLLGLLFCLMLTTTAARSQSGYYLNPGIKLGYTFGENGGFTWGAELSYTYNHNNGLFTGVTAGFDVCEETVKIHVGGEASYYIGGVDIGPTLIFDKKKSDLGLSIIPYTGLFLYPYYNITMRLNGPTTTELGSYLKFPSREDGRPLVEFK